MITRWSLVLLLTAGQVVFAHAQTRSLKLIDFIEALVASGTVIVYSNALVPSDHEVTVAELDLATLADVLAPLGLALQQREEVWFIVRGEIATQPVAAESTAKSEPVMETVIVTGSLHRFPRTGTGSNARTFTAVDMSDVPSLASDAMRATLRLPGISSMGVSAKPQIRGGLKDELLVIQDGVELLEPFHLADYHSPYSSIDYHTIESLDFYTGGFPSRYGNRMSGVMDIRNQWRDEQFNTSIGVSSFANFINTRGELGEKYPTHWLVTARQGDLSDLADYIETQSGKPRYVDLSARLRTTVSNRHEITMGTAYAKDDITFTGEDERAFSKIDTVYAWASLASQYSAVTSGHVTFSWLDFERRKQQSSVEDEAKGGTLDHRQSIQRLALRGDWSTLRGPFAWEFGLQAEYSEGDYLHHSRIDRGDLADILGTERLIERDIKAQPDGMSGGGYVQTEWSPTDDIRLQPSLRWDIQDYYLERGAQQQWSPRLGAEWDVTDELLARLSVGRFQQPEAVQELQVIDGVTRFFRPQHSDQLVTGLQWSQGRYSVTAELYYKRYKNLKGRFENTFNPFVLLPEMEPDRVALLPDKAEAKGLDLDASINLSQALTGNIRYSHMQARDHIEGNWVDRRWSQQHTVSTGLNWHRGNLQLSLAATWHSGWRSTRLPQFIPEGEVVPINSVYNNARLREYFSLDVSASYSLEIGKTQLQFYVDISNLTDRQNEAGIDFDIEETEGGFLLLPDTETLLGRIPSIGVTLSF